MSALTLKSTLTEDTLRLRQSSGCLPPGDSRARVSVVGGLAEDDPTRLDLKVFLVGDREERENAASPMDWPGGPRCPHAKRRAQPSIIPAAVKVLLASLRSTLTAEAEGWVFGAR